MPDLILMDIALTAFGSVGDREKGLASGFDGFFSKPITPTTFMDQLEAFLEDGANGRMHPTRP